MAEVFDFVKEILGNKNDIMETEQDEKKYVPYLTNRALSNHLDCIGFASMMNERPHLDNRLQFLYFINTVRSKKRPFIKSEKVEKLEDLECIKKYYGYSDIKARQAYEILDENQIQKLKEETDIGGLRK
jgi:hypothetical protein